MSSVSVRQLESVEEKVVKLGKLNRDFQIAINKEDVKQAAFKVINSLEQQFSRMTENIENGWNSL